MTTDPSGQTGTIRKGDRELRPLDRDELGRIVDAGELGAIDITFVRSLYMLAIISSVTLAFAEFSWGLANPQWPLVTAVVAWISYRRLLAGKPAVLGRIVGNLISVAAILKLLLDLGGLGNVMGAVGTLLNVLMWVKLLQNKRNRDFTQILLLTFGQMLVASVLTQAIWFAGAAILYMLIGTWVLLLLHFKREGDGDYHPLREQIVDWRAFRTRELISRAFMGVMVFALLLTSIGTFLVFISLPRFTSGWLNDILPSAPQSVSGLSDNVRLGQGGEIVQDKKAALTAEWPERPDFPVLYRAVVQTRFDPRSATWSVGSRGNFRAVRAQRLPTARAAPEGSIRVAITDRQHPRTLRQLAVPGPVWFENSQRQRVPDTHRNDTARRTEWEVAAWLESPMAQDMEYDPYSGVLRMARHQPEAISYIVLAGRPPSGAAFERARVTRASPGTYPYEDPDHRRQMRTWVAANCPPAYRGEGWTVERVNRLVDVLSEEPYFYTLDQKEPPEGRDPILWFLNERLGGHCEYFASALAMLLWAEDCQVRMVTGFGEGPTWIRQDDGVWLNFVTYACAHAWVEVNVRGHGWVPFNPSPETGAMPEEMSDWEKWLAELQHRWHRHVIRFDLGQQLDILKWLRRQWNSIRWEITRLGQTIASPFGDLGEGQEGVALALGSTVLAVPVIVLIVIVRRLRRRKQPKRTAARSSTFAPLQELLREFERQGVKRAPGTTAAEFMTDPRVTGVLDDPAERRDFLAAYHDVRFGGQSLDRDRGSLVKRILTGLRAAIRSGRRPERPDNRPAD